MKRFLVTTRYLYHFKDQKGLLIGPSCHSAVEALAVLKKHEGKIKTVFKRVYKYENDFFCRLAKDMEIPIEELTSLDQTSYRLLLANNILMEEEILSFTEAIAKFKETDGAEGLLETVKTFDLEGNSSVVSEAYILRGETITAKDLETRQVNANVHPSEKHKNSENARCIITPSGTIGFFGRYVRELDAGYFGRRYY